MFTKAENCSNHPWANLQAKSEGFKAVYAHYDETSKVLEVRYPPEGEVEIFKGVESLDRAKLKLASEVSQLSKLVFEQNV